MQESSLPGPFAHHAWRAILWNFAISTVCLGTIYLTAVVYVWRNNVYCTWFHVCRLYIHKPNFGHPGCVVASGFLLITESCIECSRKRTVSELDSLWWHQLPRSLNLASQKQKDRRNLTDLRDIRRDRKRYLSLWTRYTHYTHKPNQTQTPKRPKEERE